MWKAGTNVDSLLWDPSLWRKGEAALPNSAESKKQEVARLAGQSLGRDSNAPQTKDVFKTGAGLRPSNGLCAVGAIEGKQCQIIVDTGSNISIVHPDVQKQAGIDVHCDW